MTNPCGTEQAGYEQIVACFIKNLMLNHISCSAMVRGYAKSINMLFCLCNFPIPANFLERNNICTILISGRDKEENIARQHIPITQEMFAALKKLGNKSDIDSPETVVAGWFTFIRVTGLQVAEYKQQTESKIDVHKYPLSKQVTKVFLPTNWIFYDKNNRTIRKHPSGGVITLPKKLEVTFRIQKNWQNGQLIMIVLDDDRPDFCPVRAAYEIFLRATRLGQTDNEPIAAFVNKSGKKQYLTGNNISDVSHLVARAVHPDLSKDKIKGFSLHSGRVWALVLLDEASMAPDFMKSCLRWLGKLYHLYLHDKSILQQQHIGALSKESKEVLKLLSISNIVPEDNEMGVY